jgi:hypothetical protein
MTYRHHRMIALAGMSCALADTHEHTATVIQIPSSIQAEHEEIHNTLIKE